jgi:16S rRNA (cytosine967-C5)-methyltransferase
MKISPARIAAFEVLLGIERDKAFSSELLPRHENGLSTNDRSLCHQLTLGVLRKQLMIDKIIDMLSNGKRIDPEVRIALKLGIYQLYFLAKVPDYSAVNDSVNLVQRAKKTSAKGLVNAVLRRAAREQIVPVFKDEIERISLETSHPRWLIEKWIGRFGIADAEKLATANNEIPRTAFRFTKKRSTRSKEFENARASEHAVGCFIAEANSSELLAAADAGEIYFQDEGSQIVGASVNLTENGRFLDLCAAPGSKFTQILARSTRSQRLVAGDLHSRRAQFIAENCRNQGLENANIVQYDAEYAIPFPEDFFDTILIDAPCSGTGTIRHNPEIRYTLEPSVLTELSGKQLRLIQNASKHLRPGGKLIYSTCSLESEENESVCRAFLADASDFQRSRPAVPEQFIDDEGYARTFPHRDGMDGFFIASFEKHRP